MPDVFLSYNREDQATARRFAEAFQAQSLDVWWDTTLRAGEPYDEVTETALRTAKAVVVLWSKKSVASRWVRAEATLADRNKTLVPCTIEPCERPIMFELTHTAELSHWQGAADDRAWLAFLGDVTRFVQRDRATPLQAPPTPKPAAMPGEKGEAPSLAVLPFTNRSSLPEDEVFAEGMVEDVISALSQGVHVRVLGSSATGGLRRHAITDLAAVGRQLGVRYLLEGNVRRAGANLRVTTQLLEAATGAVLWTAKFDRPLTELAGLQEDLVLEVAASLDTQVFRLEMERALRKPADITAWEAVVRAVTAYRDLDGPSLLRAIAEAARAVEIAPDYAAAQAMYAAALANFYFLASPDDPVAIQRVREMVHHALALEAEDAVVLWCAGAALSMIGLPQEGLHYTARAIRKAPNDGLVQFTHGAALFLLDRSEEALPQFDLSIRLMPGSPFEYFIEAWRWNAFIRMGRWSEAEAAVDAAIALNPNFWVAHSWKAIFLLHRGDASEAQREFNMVRESWPSLANFELTIQRAYTNSDRLDELLGYGRALWAATEPA